MTGGLLQLATVGKEDSPLIKKPQLFHFKKIYLRYKNFSIDNNRKIVGDKNFDTDIEIKLDKEGDLLKDLFFYLEIPYFNILKKITTEKTINQRYEADPVYLNLANSKSYVFNTDQNKFYIIPEYIFKNPKGIEIGDYNNIVEVVGKDYSGYFNENSDVKLYNYENKIHPIIKDLKTLDDTWFNNFINSVINNDSLNINLMDFQKFNEWFNSYTDDRIFFNFPFNFNNNINLYNINFEEDRKINEIKKYFEILNRGYKIDSSYSDESLDIDKAILYLLEVNNNREINAELITEEQKKIILNSVLYNSNFLLYVLKMLYDDSNTNYFSFYKRYSVNSDNNNEVVKAGTLNYEDSIWSNYIDKFFHHF